MYFDINEKTQITNLEKLFEMHRSSKAEYLESRKSDEIPFWFDNWIKDRNLVEILEVIKESFDHPETKICEFIQ